MSEETTRTRRIHKASFAGITKQPALPDASDENVRKSIVVVVADSHTHTVHFDLEARASRHICERAVAVVPVEPQRGSLALVSGPVHAVDEKNGLPAIAIVIEKCTNGTPRLREELGRLPAAALPGPG